MLRELPGRFDECPVPPLDMVEEWEVGLLACALGVAERKYPDRNSSGNECQSNCWLPRVTPPFIEVWRDTSSEVKPRSTRRESTGVDANDVRYIGAENPKIPTGSSPRAARRAPKTCTYVSKPSSGC